MDVPDELGRDGNGHGMVCGEGPSPFRIPRNVREHHIQNVVQNMAGTNVTTTNIPRERRSDGLPTDHNDLIGWNGLDRVVGIGPRSDIMRNLVGFLISDNQCTCTRSQCLMARFWIGDWWRDEFG